MAGPFTSPVAKAIPFDGPSNSMTSEDVEAGIVEAKNTAPGTASRFAVLASFDGSASATRWLEFSANNPSNQTPFAPAENCVVKSLSLIATSNATCTVTVYKNGVSIQTISLSSTKKNSIKNLNLSVNELDEISIAVTSGSANKPAVTIFFQTV